MRGQSERGVSATVALLPLAGLMVVVAFVMGIAVAAGGSAGCGGEEGEEATGTLKGDVPKRLVPIYQAASARYRLGLRGPAMLASINFNETSFGTNMTNTTGSGAEGWMMFMPETWATYGVDANGDGKKDPYDPEDAIFAAARYLNASGAPADWHKAVFAYNHAEWYVERIFGDAARFQGAATAAVSEAAGSGCAGAVGGNAMLKHAQRLFRPRAFKPLPQGLMAAGRAPEEVDARIWPDAVWLLRTYNLRVTAAREPGHMTHGDGTALDMVPAGGSWDSTAKRAAEELGWTEGCAASGVKPACGLVPAIHFIGYNGYPLHGDPQHSAIPHLHVSWESSGYGSCPQVLCGPEEWVMIFPVVR